MCVLVGSNGTLQHQCFFPLEAYEPLLYSELPKAALCLPSGQNNKRKDGTNTCPGEGRKRRSRC